MQSSTQTVRSPVPPRVLWKWTFLSALLHLGFIGGLCYSSYLQGEKREAALKSKAAADASGTPEGAPANAVPAEPSTAAPGAATEAATAARPVDKAPSAPAPAQPAPAPTVPTPPGSGATAAPASKPLDTVPADPAKTVSGSLDSGTAKAGPSSAEKILGIDKVAKPEEAPKGANPFSSKDDDLLKDLK